jgi:hypothetical protein
VTRFLNHYSIQYCLRFRFLAFSGLHSNANIIFIFNICETNTIARKTQLKLCNHVATWMESYFVQTYVAQNIFAQHDWSWMGPFTFRWWRNPKDTYFRHSVFTVVVCFLNGAVSRTYGITRKWRILERRFIMVTVYTIRGTNMPHVSLHYMFRPDGAIFRYTCFSFCYSPHTGQCLHQACPTRARDMVSWRPNLLCQL